MLTFFNRDLWNKEALGRQCLSSQHEAYMFWSHAGIGLLIDVLLMVIPFWIIYARMISSATTKRVLLIFSVGFFVVVTGAIRLGSTYLLLNEN
jgi:heme/copper-type cytochrome/quinol oxidase subunit 4